MTPEWLNRSMIVGPYFTLCLSSEAFRAEVDRLKWSDTGPWLSCEHADATTHFGANEDGELTAIVCMRPPGGRDPVTVAGLLVHEAVHVWQRWCDRVGEHSPGAETEAYSVQWLSQQLMWEFVRQTGGQRAT